MRNFLFFKTWALFLLILAPLCFIAPGTERLFVNLVGLLCLTLWHYSIGYYGHMKLAGSQSKGIDLPTFQIAVIAFPLMAIALSITLYALPETFRLLKPLLANGLAIITLVTYVYVVLQSSKVIVELEDGDKATVPYYVITFLYMLTIAPGIWFVQPRVNKLFGKKHLK